MILKFSASWCMPCKQLSNTISTLTPEQQAMFQEIDVDQCDKTLLEKYNIRGVPALVKVDDKGNQLGMSVGNITKEKLLSMLSN